MNYGLYLSASGVLTNMHRQDIAAANLSNVHTDGFKRSVVSLMHRDAEAVEDRLGPGLRHDLLDRLGGGVLAGKTRLDLSMGSLRETSRPLDVALTGKGYFSVQVDDGQTTVQRLTRDGRWTQSPDNRLVTVTGGHAVLDVANLPITINPALGKVHIDADGTIRQGQATVARLKLIDVPNDSLRSIGHGLFEVGQAVLDAAQPANAGVEQGFLEQSNVDPIKELMKLIAATKAVSSNGNLIRYHDLLMDRAANVLGRVA